MNWFFTIWAFTRPKTSVRKSSGRSDQRRPPGQNYGHANGWPQTVVRKQRFPKRSWQWKIVNLGSSGLVGLTNTIRSPIVRRLDSSWCGSGLQHRLENAEAYGPHRYCHFLKLFIDFVKSVGISVAACPASRIKVCLKEPYNFTVIAGLLRSACSIYSRENGALICFR